MTQEEMSICYAPLFDLLSADHDVILTCSEMDGIIRASLKVVENIENL